MVWWQTSNAERAARNAKLASLPVGIAGRAALGFGKRLTGKSKDEVNAELMEKAAHQLFTVLGELKGGAMKVGQALSVMEAAIPEQFGEPYREALTKLQKEAPPLPASKVHRVLDAQLGTKWRQRFADFDDTPVASASIGQVHKAVWSDGREVAVKIQYPGADEALRADLKTMQRMVGVLKQLSPGADVQGVVDELIERTEMELDYRLEADNQRAFAKAYQGHPHFVVPHIVASAPKVVIQEWIEGIPMSEIIREGTAEQRDLMGTRLAELTFDAPRAAGDDARRRPPGQFHAAARRPDGRHRLRRGGTAARRLPDRARADDSASAATRTTTCCCRRWRRPASSRRASRFGARDRRHAAPVRRAPRGRGLPLHPQVAAEDDHGEHGPVGCADQDRAPDGFAGQAGDPDAGDRVDRGDPLPAGRPCAGQSAGRRTDSGLRRRSGLIAECTPASAICRRLRLGEFLRGRPRGRLRRDDRATVEDLAAPHSPRLCRSSAAARHWRRIGQSAHSALARSKSDGLSANHRSGSPT